MSGSRRGECDISSRGATCRLSRSTHTRGAPSGVLALCSSSASSLQTTAPAADDTASRRSPPVSRTRWTWRESARRSRSLRSDRSVSAQQNSAVWSAATPVAAGWVRCLSWAYGAAIGAGVHIGQPVQLSGNLHTPPTAAGRGPFGQAACSADGTSILRFSSHAAMSIRTYALFPVTGSALFCRFGMRLFSADGVNNLAFKILRAMVS